MNPNVASTARNVSKSLVCVALCSYEIEPRYGDDKTIRTKMGKHVDIFKHFGEFLK